MAITLFPSKADRLPFVSAFGCCSRQGSSLTVLEISGADFLIHKINHHGLLSQVAWLRVILLNVLFLSCHYCSELIRPPYLHFVQALQDIVRGYLMAGQKLTVPSGIKALDIVTRKVALNGPE